MNEQKIATIFGGTGFLGRQIVRELAMAGYTVKVATRRQERAYFLKTCGVVGQIVPFECNYSDPGSIEAAIKGSSCVVNTIGILTQSKRASFQNAHVDLPANIAKECKKEGVSKFVHISALGVDKARSKYAVSKLEGEEAVRKNFPDATILRPSLIFGPEDNFFNMFAEMARYLPVLPLIGGGKTRFQPVYVGDVAAAVMKAIENESAQGKIYELGGEEIVTFKEIMEKLFYYTERPRYLIPVPWMIAKIQAWFMGILPSPPITVDQVESLKTDSILSKDALNLRDLDVAPTSMALILPCYLERYCSGGHYSSKKGF
jgi:NADH dehydrogenase